MAVLFLKGLDAPVRKKAERQRLPAVFPWFVVEGW
jgi:hypothetical protein